MQEWSISSSQNKDSDAMSDGAEAPLAASRSPAADAPNEIDMAPPTPEGLEITTDSHSDVSLESVTNAHAGLMDVCRKFGAVPMSSCGPRSMDRYIASVIRSYKMEDNFYVCDLGAVQRAYDAWVANLPRVKPYYAVKCHPNPGILSTLAALGAGFDCASPGEIDLVCSLGVHPDRIIYANPCKRPSDLKFARKMGVTVATYDTVSELDKVAMYHPELKMVLRIRADDPGARCQLGNKFGSEPDMWEELVDAAIERNIALIGVSFHVGSGASSSAAFERAIVAARSVFDMALQKGVRLSLIDIGGGFTATLDEDGNIHLGAMPPAVNAALDAHFPAADGYTVISEPGRYMVEKSCAMATQVIGKRPRRFPDGGLEMHYWITDGLYGSMNCVIYDHMVLKPHPLVPAEEEEELISTTLFGPTCDGLDTVIRDYQFPEMQIGDWVVFEDMGAYTIAGATDFNGIKVTNAKFFYVASSKRSLLGD